MPILMIVRRALCVGAALCLTFAVLAPPAAAQETEDELPELNSLKPSSAPAFILLGVAPASVERPQTPSDVAFSLVNQTETFSTLPENYAAEISPYWLFSRPTLGWRDDIDRSPATSFQRTLTLSLATAELGNEEAPMSGVGFGASAYLLSGRMSSAAQARFQEIEKYLAARDSLESVLVASQLAAIEAEYGRRIAEAAQAGNTELVRLLTAEVSAKTLAARLAAQQDSVFKQWEVNNPLEQLQEATPQRAGLFWGVAGGASWGFANDVWKAGHVHNLGLWSTLSYEGTQVGEESSFTPMVVARLLSNRGGDSVSTTFDAGGRFMLSGPAYTASVEGILRMPLEEEGEGEGDTETLYRIAGILEYRLRPDLWLTATFGRDYQSSNDGSLLAQLGVKFHVTEDRYQAP
ncbi:MAG TPA: hypothetical protein VGC13_20615 [Longimicrobium sp.]|jgi:hypothetical protein|uniref:hypothetical protein n=1 Tax=Longimicrobium sp. TaxID=2029185 RepID=UPI002ED96F30